MNIFNAPLKSKSKDDYAEENTNLNEEEYFDELEQEPDETTTINENFLIDLDDIEPMIKNCDECFDVVERKDAEFGGAGCENEEHHSGEYNLKRDSHFKSGKNCLDSFIK